MVFAAGISYRYIVGAAAGRAAGAVRPGHDVATTAGGASLAFLDPWDDPLGDGFQIIQSMIAVGTGGVFGRGLMGGVQKLFYLPEPHTDFIYAVIARGARADRARRSCSPASASSRGAACARRCARRIAFGAFLALGLTTMVAFQAFFNISVVLGLLPTKGIPLPFVSAGGSSLLDQPGRAWGSCSTCRSTRRRRTSSRRRCRRRMHEAAARRDRRRRHRRPSVSGHRRRARAAARGSRTRVVTFAGTRAASRRGWSRAKGFALDLLRSAGLKGKSLGARLRGAGAAAARRASTRGGSVAPPPGSGDRRRRLQLGPGGAGRGAARHSDDAARAERGARPDQPAARAGGQRGGGDVRLDGGVLRKEGHLSAGNPVRPEFFGQPRRRSRRACRTRRRGFLIFGGSQGAHAINVAMVEAAPRLAAQPGAAGDHASDRRTRSGAGPRRLPRARGSRPGWSRSSSPWTGEMRAADLVVCRAGATTLAELTAAGKAGDADPAADRGRRSPAEERRGAGAAGAAEMIEQKTLTGSCSGARISATGATRPQRRAMAAGGAIVATADDAADVVGSLRRLAHALDARRARHRRHGRWNWRADANVTSDARARRGAIHFVGIGGIGMSGIAELLANLGYEVSGSDAKRSDVTDGSSSSASACAIGHDAGARRRRGRRGDLVGHSGGQPGGRRGRRRGRSR